MSAPAQVTTLPLQEWKAATESPLVFYITGDGGFNDFSTGLCTAINKAGYAVSSLNAKSYFWNKKTALQTATAIAAYVAKQFNGRQNQQLILVGYSFGADVIPFVVNKLPDAMRKKVGAVILLSPSGSTDLEIHFTDMFGGNKKRSMDVVAEINKMASPKTVTLFGSDETYFPVKDITLKNYINEVLLGGHHLDGNTAEIAKTIIRYFK